MSVESRRGHPLSQIPEAYEAGMSSGFINLLPRTQRDVLILRFEDPRMSLREISEQKSLRISTVLSRQNRGLSKLEEALGGWKLKDGDFMIGGVPE